tara:strand:+ start:192857 stop:193702 length:846 start_codon:yes stop_codon:yes gene_type:complete
MNRPIRLGISTCPNDTFAFAALMNRKISWRGLQFEVELLDIQQLNDRLFAGSFDVAKTSFHAAMMIADRFGVLPSGSALGFGVGPLLLASADDSKPSTAEISEPKPLTLCPGQHTTATLLFHLFYPNTTRLRQVVFSQIMPDLKSGLADFGVCIHEGRFTWQDEGLFLVEDLGTRWETETGCPLPLGGLAASKQLPPETIETIQGVVRDSIEYSLASPQSALPTMRQYAQEFDDDVLMQHVDLYVNEWTVDLGDVGRRALDVLAQKASRVGDYKTLDILTG